MSHGAEKGLVWGLQRSPLPLGSQQAQTEGLYTIYAHNCHDLIHTHTHTPMIHLADEDARDAQ